ncbi:Ku protein [Thermomonas sp.]|jgi:DNA end-binding protein Ku|uniref:non-homologous end joining protein Ku n=1 Tax=Thermomonas sp. TaxID=1971895 RepID=UPI0025802A35|nr:Ku protein [Thermomonas sp.]
MPRPIWSGSLSFGLLNIPVQLMAGTRTTDLSFRMLDARDKSPIRYERVNAETGEEVPWKEIVKAFEYDKGSYVVLEQEDIRSAAPESHDAIEVEAFVDVEAIGPQYFEKPYVLVPAKRAEKGYVLLRETLKRTGRMGIARIVIRTRENLCALLPQGDALLLVMMRYPQELVDAGDYALPAGQAGDYRISPRELEMAEALIASMESEWKPAGYRDEFRARLQKVIEKRIKAKGGKVRKSLEEPALRDDATTNVVDFMSLLQKSIDAKRRTPASKAVARKPAKTASKAGKPGKAAAAKPKPAKRAAKSRTAR